MTSSRPLSSTQERDWIVGLRAGRVEIYQKIFETFTPILWRFARVSVPGDIAEDIVQDVLFDLWNRRDTIEIRDSLQQYLLGAVRYGVWRYLRHQRVVTQTEDTSDHEFPPGLGTPVSSPEDTVLANELQRAILAVLNSLSELQRAILILRWTHEMSYEQIASTLSISVESARQHVSRTQRVIRPLLEHFRHNP